VPKASSRYLLDISVDLKSGLERLLECSSQRLSKLEEIRPRGYSRAQKGTGPPPEISRDKAFQSKVTLGEVSREPFPDIRRTYRRLLPDVSEISRDTRAGACGTKRFEILISSRDVSLVPRKSLLEPLENSGRASGVSGSVSNGSARVRSQKGKHFIPTGG
jgi:hypothetical protein